MRNAPGGASHKRHRATDRFREEISLLSPVPVVLCNLGSVNPRVHLRKFVSKCASKRGRDAIARDGQRIVPRIFRSTENTSALLLGYARIFPEFILHTFRNANSRFFHSFTNNSQQELIQSFERSDFVYSAPAVRTIHLSR